jgi:NAD(P)H-dependent flavin oxidoreductase YrpB (nitropropane dioxygenase family)
VSSRVAILGLLATGADPRLRLVIMPLLARVELEIHTRVERGDARTAETTSELMAELYRRGYGDAVGDIPVVAACGIADGQGLAAALLLGVTGSWLGTRIVASEAWGGNAWEQQAVLAATADDTTRTFVFDQIRGAPFPEGIADRVLRNAFTTTWEGRPHDMVAHRAELRGDVEAASQRGDPAGVEISAGVTAGLISSREPAGSIVRRIMAEAERALRAGCVALRH